MWEEELLREFEAITFNKIKVARFTSTTLEDELENNTNSVRPFVAVTLTIMTMFSIFVCLMGDWVRGKPILGMIGVVTAVLSSFAAFGFLIYLGVPFIGINMAAPFLMLGTLAPFNLCFVDSLCILCTCIFYYYTKLRHYIVL